MFAISSIRGKILLASSLSALIISFAVGTALFGFYRMTGRILFFINSQEPSYVAEVDLLRIGLQNELSIRNHIFDPNDPIPPSVFRKTDAQFINTVTGLRRSPGISPEEKAKLSDILSRWNLLTALKRPLIEWNGTGVSEAEAVKKALKVTDQWRPIRKIILQLIGRAAESVRSEREAMQSLYVSTMRSSLLFIFAGLVIGFFYQSRVLTRVTKAFDPLLLAAQRMAQRNLTGTLGSFGNDETGRLGEAMKRMLNTLILTLRNVRAEARNVDETGQSVTGIFSELVQTSRKNQEESQASREGLMNFRENVSEVARNLGRISDMVKVTAKEVLNGTRTGEETTTLTDTTGQEVSEACKNLQNLQQATSRIAHVTQAIQEITDQTNMLSLNAAIEASRAGMHGKGFAVVADEVRKLSLRTQQQTKEIEETIRLVNEFTGQAVSSMERVQGSMGQVVAKGKETKKAFMSIMNGMNTVEESVSNAERTLTALLQSEKHMSGLVENVDVSVARTFDMVATGQKSIVSLETAVNNLNGVLKTFTMPEESEEKARAGAK